MSNRKKRTYHSDKRQAQAMQTRGRILTCAKKLFESKGFEGVTIEAIAQAAEVAVPTIYALFQSKRRIIRVLIDEALPPEHFEELVKQAHQEKSAVAHLKISAKIARQLYDAERAQMNTLWATSILTPEFKELEREREIRRYKRQEKTIETLAKAQALLKELTLSQARVILWAFTGRDMYRLFVLEQGWTSDDYECWLAQMLVKALLKDETDLCERRS